MTRLSPCAGTALLAAFFALANATPALAADAKAYVINEIQVTDAAKYKVYVDQVPATLAPYGGAFIVRGGKTELVDGAPIAGRIVVVEFPNLAQAKAWHDSPRYQEILALRNASSTSRVYYVEGVAP